ncbi:hypothetical protein EV421DRAFT_1900039 [Armillaria borealis]|uniref:Uncharacterized protein n=1 Tax=Armillaria borealis TaxID=47425 RepID=A0AA39JWY9_9AGAR|nr:hypothetical protein EV421DRAFT_1900039 [Armillaria borealis]
MRWAVEARIGGDASLPKQCFTLANGNREVEAKEEQKVGKVILKKQQDVGKIKVAQVKDQMCREDVVHDLNANHPRAKAIKKSKDITTADTSFTPVPDAASPGAMSQDCEPSKDLESIMERERHAATKAKTATSKAKNVNFSEGSGDDLSGFHPEVDNDDSSDGSEQVASQVETTAHVTVKMNSDITKTSAQKGRKEKTMACATIASFCTMSSAVGTPSTSTTVSSEVNPAKKAKSSAAPKVKGGLVEGWKKAKHVKKESEADNSLVHLGGPVAENEDPLIEYRNVIKLEQTNGDLKHLSLVKITLKEEASVTATKACGGVKKWTLAHLDPGMHDAFTKKIIPYVHEHLVGTSNNPWIPLTADEVQTTVDQFYPPGTYTVASKGTIFGLIGYCLNDTWHAFGAEAIKCTEKFFNKHSEMLSSPEQIMEFYDFEADGTTKKSGLFCHQLIVDTLVLAHFSMLPPISSDLKSIARPKGTLLLAIQAVKCALSMWTTGILVTNNIPEFSRQNYNDFKEDHTISIEECAKHSNSAKMKTVKIKCISKWLKMLNSWTDSKWESFMQAVKASIKDNSGKRKHKEGLRICSLSSIEIIEEESDGEIPASDPPDILENTPMNIDLLDDLDIEPSKT